MLNYRDYILLVRGRCISTSFSAWHLYPKWQIEHAVALIRDGYHLYNLPDGTEAFVVRISDGFPAELLYPGRGLCINADIKQKGPKAVAEEIRRQTSGPDRTRREFKWPQE